MQDLYTSKAQLKNVEATQACDDGDDDGAVAARTMRKQQALATVIDAIGDESTPLRTDVYEDEVRNALNIGAFHFLLFSYSLTSTVAVSN